MLKKYLLEKNAQGDKTNRLKSAGSALGDTAVALLNAGTTASMAIPVVGEGAKAADVALNTAVKGGKMLKDVAGTKAAALTTAATVALSPVTHGIEAAKAGTAISRSIDSARAGAAADSFVPKTVKAASSGVPDAVKVATDVKLPAKASTTLKAGTGSKVGATGIIGSHAISKFGEFNNGAANNTASDTTKTNTTNTYNDTVNTQSKFETKDTNKDANKDSNKDANKGGDGYTSNYYNDPFKDINKDANKDANKGGDEYTSNYNDPFKDINNIKNPYQNESPGPPVVPREPLPPKEEPAKKRKPKPRLNIKNKKASTWNPSSIV